MTKNMLSMLVRMKRWVSAAVFIAVLVLLQASPSFAYDVTIRVQLLRDQSALNITCNRKLTVKNAYTLNDMATGLNKVTVTGYNGVMGVNGKRVDVKHIYVTTDDYRTPVKLNGVPYRGYYLVGLNENDRLMVVNHVGLEDYLGGVLGGEIMPSWPLEAIKAQAVAARTYVIHRIEANRNEFYDVTNDTRDQMYVGVQGEASIFTRALKETRGQVLAMNGNLICAYYHSSCGGATSDSNSVFRTGDASFNGTRDPYCAGSPNSTWNLRLNSDSVAANLKRSRREIGKIFSIKAESLDGAGRVVSVHVEHENGTTTIPGHEFRRLLGYGSLKSTRFNVYPQNYFTYRSTKIMAANRMKYQDGTWSNTSSASGGTKVAPAERKIPATFVFTGSGWGHGVGMCQWGARGMALNKYTYRQILGYYYPKTAICIVENKK